MAPELFQCQAPEQNKIIVTDTQRAQLQGPVSASAMENYFFHIKNLHSDLDPNESIKSLISPISGYKIHLTAQNTMAGTTGTVKTLATSTSKRRMSR